MRLFAAVFIVLLSSGLIFGGSEAAMAQGYCPFVAFCDAQHYHCYRNCGALTDVVAWPARPPFLQRCSYGCERQLNRCMYRAARWCR
jgi:hypothetical protein